MIARILKPLTSLLIAMLREDSAAVLAASLTMGMMAGFLPKDNLLAIVFGVLLLSLRFNLTVATASAAVFSGVAAMFDPIAEALGRAVLTHHSLDPLWAWVYQLPLAPWTRFNNTVVMGSLLLALALATPMYLTSRYLVVQYRPRLLDWLRQTGFEQWLDALDGSTERRAA
jgi:uncharacterized protein (TIGR03546 family)